MNHFAVHLKLTQHCKSTKLQLKEEEEAAQEQKDVRKKMTLLAHLHPLPPDPSHCFLDGVKRRFESNETEVLKYRKS